MAAPSSRTALGELIRRQRELSALPLRQFATMAGISGPYLSQIERGLRAPSDAVLRAIAESLQTTADALYADAGYTVVEESDDDAPARVAAALEADPELTASQRRSLLETYTAFRDANTVRRRRVADAAAASDGAAPED